MNMKHDAFKEPCKETVVKLMKASNSQIAFQITSLVMASPAIQNKILLGIGINFHHQTHLVAFNSGQIL
jgi:hypothetical protein